MDSRSLPIKRIIGIIILIVLAVFFIKVGLWEIGYYTSKEGTERAKTEASAIVVPGDEVSEEPVTIEQRLEYTVPASHPRYLSITKLNIDKARVRSVSLTTNGAIDTPNNINDVAWYNGSALPGSGGTVVIDGHNGGPKVDGVFKHLPDLLEGDIITIERGDGRNFNYQIVENKAVSITDANKYMKTALSSPIEGKESLTLITCSGDWSAVQKTYLSRQFVRAILI